MMRRRTRDKWLSIIAGTLIVTGSFGWNSAGRADDASASIQQLNTQLAQIKEQLSTHKQQVQTLKNEKASIESQIAAIQLQIQDMDQQIQMLSDKLKLVGDQIAKVTEQVNQTQKQLDQTNDLLQKRLVVMYEKGDVSYLNVLMNSTDFSDFVDRLDLLALIVKQDKDLLAKVKELKEQLLDQQADLAKQQAEQLSAKAQLDASLAEQQRHKAEQLALQEQVSKNIAMTEDQIKKDEQEQSAAESFLAAKIAAQLQAQPQPYQGNPNSRWVWPVPSSHFITSGYGPRDGGFHKGIDIGAPVGTPIVAVADGRVLFSGTAQGFGHWIVIQHGPGLLSIYGHMYADGLLVSEGQVVKAGQVIAKVGSDGESTGPHLHFSVATGISGGRMLYVNPNPYLP